jgi:hypothetical protein
MSNNKPIKIKKLDELNKFEALEELTKVGLPNKEVHSYMELQKDPIKSEAYIISKIYNLNQELIQKMIMEIGHLKTLEFTDFYFKILKRQANDFFDSYESAKKGGFSFVPKETSLLEKEVSECQKKFNLDLNQVNYRGEVSDSSHYHEHFGSRLDREHDY